MPGLPLLSLLTFLPAAGAALLLLLPRERLTLLRALAVAVTAADFLLAVRLYARFDPAEAGMQFVEEAAWIPRLGIQYLLGVDGISLPLVLLTAFLGVVVAAASLPWIQARVKEYYICLLLLQTGMLGVFLALDLILFYVFWEAMLIPMYFLIGIWGGPRRIYATIKFFLFTMAGSVLMLLAIFALFVLFSLTCNAQIEKLYKGDVVRQDSVVCMDVPTYRTVRLSVSSCDKLLANQDVLLLGYKDQVSVLQQSVTDRDTKISEQDRELTRVRKDLDDVRDNFIKLQVSTSKTLVDIEKRLPNKSVFKRLDFWAGVALGAGGTFLLLK